MKKTVLLSLAVMASYILAEAQFIVTPKVGAPVEVSGNVLFSANADKTSWSIGDSYDSSLDLSQIASISLAEGENKAKPGDFFYSDGTWSTTLDVSKTPIGVVFYIGDPTEHDAALRAAHPECVHGLVVGLKQKKCEWQDYYSDFDDEVGMSVGEWIEENTDYVSIATRSEALNSVFNQIMGYNNTCGIDAFNDEYGWDYEVLVGSELSAVATGAEAPVSTSGWYVPSVKEVSLLCSGDLGGSIGDLGYGDVSDNANVVLINERLAQISGAVSLSGVYWSSTEYSVTQAHSVQFSNGLVMQTSKGGSNNLRPVLAF